ncbi:insulinase family protein [Treponema sp. OMZ 840]|uniref:M16 family metallopeptidase n=1 Tax=Treponema sp. OMZ 840 TaxID=244313 RepID=UPI003D9121A2
MSGKSILLTLCILGFFFSAVFLTAQTDSEKNDNPLPEGFYAYKLENGLELYVQEDFTLPALRIEYVSKAGTAKQQKDNAGFFRLYSRLFWQNEVSAFQSYIKAGAGDFTAECTSSQSRYGFSLPVQSFEKVFSLFAASLKHQIFSDTVLQNEFGILKTETAAWASSAGGFINSTVDSLVFSQAPWKKDSGVYPALFAKMTIEEVRQKLSHIAKNWYVPNQSALFISGPLDAQKILYTVKHELSDWEYSFYVPQDTQREAGSAQNRQNRFVLVSKDFSPDFNQVLIQYTAPGLGADSVFSAAAWTAAEILQSKWGLHDFREKDISFSADGADSRISIQALFAAGLNVKKDNPADALENLLKEINAAVQNITKKDLEDAKKRARLLRSQAFRGPESFIQALSAHWAYGGTEYFFTWPQRVQDVSVQQVKNVFTSPWIFVFVHPNQYKVYEKQFTKAHWKTFTPKKNAAVQTEKTAAKDNGAIQTKPLEKHTEYTKNLIKRFTLSSGIEVHMQQLPNTDWTSCILNIRGGELKHGFSKKGLESIALLNLAERVKLKLAELYMHTSGFYPPDIKTAVELFSGRIVFTCMSEDIAKLLHALSAAVQNTDVSPAQADELYFAEAFKRRNADSSLDNQLYSAAMETFFGSTDAAPFFNSNAQLLPAVTYEEIRNACLSLYNPEDFSLIFCGNIPQNISEISERCFGKSALAAPLPNLEKPVHTKDSFIPAFTEGERTVRLHRLFLTDVSAEAAGERPAKLIPTTDFSDPAQLYFKSPEFGTKEEVIFAALIHEIAERLTEDFQAQKNAPAAAAAAKTDFEPFFLASLNFIKVKNKIRVQKAFENCITELASDLRKNSHKKSDTDCTLLCEDIKSRYTGTLSRSFTNLESRANLMRQGLEYTGNTSFYTERLLFLNNANQKDFFTVFEAYIEKAPLFWIFSADTKKK